MPAPRVQTFDLTALPEQLRGPVDQALGKPLKLFMDEAARSLGAVWARGDSLALYEDVQVDVPADWIAPSFVNGWADYALAGEPAVGYRKTEAGDLELRGRVTQPGAVGLSTMFTVGSAFLPEGNVGPFTCHTIDATPVDNVAWVSILSTGAVQWTAGYTDISQPVSLFGIRTACLDRQPYQAATPNNFPVELPWTLERKPIGLFLVEARERIPTGSSAVRCPVGGVDWDLTDLRGERRLRVRRVAGLVPSKSYTLRLVAIGG